MRNELLSVCRGLLVPGLALGWSGVLMAMPMSVPVGFQPRLIPANAQHPVAELRPAPAAPQARLPTPGYRRLAPRLPYPPPWARGPLPGGFLPPFAGSRPGGYWAPMATAWPETGGPRGYWPVYRPLPMRLPVWPGRYPYPPQAVWPGYQPVRPPLPTWGNPFPGHPGPGFHGQPPWVGYQGNGFPLAPAGVWPVSGGQYPALARHVAFSGPGQYRFRPLNSTVADRQGSLEPPANPAPPDRGAVPAGRAGYAPGFQGMNRFPAPPVSANPYQPALRWPTVTPWRGQPSPIGWPVPAWGPGRMPGNSTGPLPGLAMAPMPQAYRFRPDPRLRPPDVMPRGSFPLSPSRESSRWSWRPRPESPQKRYPWQWYPAPLSRPASDLASGR